MVRQCLPASGADATDPPAAGTARARWDIYRVDNAKLGYQSGVTDDLSIEFGLFCRPDVAR